MIVALPRCASFWMVQTELGLEYLDRAPIQRLSLVVLALVLKQNGEVVVVGCNVGVILAENSFVDLDGPPIKRLGLIVLALGLKQTGEVVVVSSNSGMI